MVARAAGHHEDLGDGPELLVGEVDLVEHQGAVGQDPVEQRVGHRLGLLVHLLGHEVVEAVLAGGVEVPVDVQRGGLDRLAVERGHRDRPGAQLGDPVVVEDEEVVGQPEDGRDVRGQEGRPVGHPHDERRDPAGGHDDVGVLGVDDGEGEGAPHLGPGRPGPRPTRPSSGWAARWASIRWASTSVSVSDSSWWPSAMSRSDSSTWFSMMPLWTRARSPVQSAWGWALPSFGRPWVAHRVWPMPADGSAGALLGPLDQVVERAGAVGGPDPPHARRRRSGRPAPDRPSRSRGTRGGPGPRPGRRGPARPPPSGPGPLVMPMMPHMDGHATRRAVASVRPRRAGTAPAGATPAVRRTAARGVRRPSPAPRRAPRPRRPPGPRPGPGPPPAARAR